MPAVESRPLLVLDGDNLAHRAYHALPPTIRGVDGRPLNAVVGWTSMALAVWERVQPRAVFVAWDTLGVPTYRHALWPAYQADRTLDDALRAQLAVLPAVARALGFGVGQQAGCEADDLIAAAVAAETAQGGTCVVLTTDRDLFQLVSARVTVLAPGKRLSDLAEIGPAQVEARLGVPPALVADFKALAGDASDRLPGARGIGARRAALLLRQHGSLAAVLATRPAWAADQPEGDRLRRFRDIVTLQPACAPVELPASGPPAFVRAAAFLRELGAVSLAERVAARAAA